MYGYFCDEHINAQTLPIYGYQDGVQVNLSVVDIAHTLIKSLYTIVEVHDKKTNQKKDHFRKNKFVGIVLDQIYGVENSEDAAHNTEIIHKKYTSKNIKLPDTEDILSTLYNICKGQQKYDTDRVCFSDSSDIDHKPKLIFIPTVCYCSKYAHLH
jgi:hypothetical protein